MPRRVWVPLLFGLAAAVCIAGPVRAQDADSTSADSTVSDSTDSVQTLVRIVNGLDSLTIHHVYISPVDTNDWGPDWLDPNETIGPKAAMAWVVSPGNYDLRVVDEAGDTYTINNVEVDEGQTSEWTVIADDRDTGSSGKSDSTGQDDQGGD